jgi:hypothetical protein
VISDNSESSSTFPVNTTTSNPSWESITARVRMDQPSRGCPTCLYFSEIPGSRYGTCHRFPEAVTVAEDYWCGEWKSLHGAFETK